MYFERGERRETGRETLMFERSIHGLRETSVSLVSHAPSWGSGPQPRHEPLTGNQVTAFWFTGRLSGH